MGSTPIPSSLAESYAFLEIIYQHYLRFLNSLAASISQTYSKPLSTSWLASCTVLATLQSNPTPSTSSEINSLQSQITSLQAQLANATALITQLQGPTGILPTYMNLNYVGPISSGGSYFRQLWLRNTGSVAINQIFVTINSEQISMTFTYLDKTVSADAPLPAYQTATARRARISNYKFSEALVMPAE